MNTRKAAVAGMFYPADAVTLRKALEFMLQQAKISQPRQLRPHALIVPHAGYIYSGEVAASAYHHLATRKQEINRVLLLGPSHRVPLSGAACPTVSHFATPLGEIDLDQKTIATLAKQGMVSLRDDAHTLEHSLEVQLPFLQVMLNRFLLVPVVVGETKPAVVADIIEMFWHDTTTLIVVSTDLSHYLDYTSARARDRQTTAAIKTLDFAQIGPEDACGCYPLGGLLYAAKKHQRTVITVDQRNSGDTAGSRDQVVGYGAYVIE